MKKYELEALLKNFFIFFSLLLLLLWIIYLQSFNSEKSKYDNKILENMKLCSYTLNCKEYKLDFINKNKQKVATLNRDNHEIYSLFHIPNSNEFLLKLSLDKKEYLKQIQNIKQELIKKFLLYGLLIGVISFIFSLYSLHPLKKALYLNETFIKDILHDFNTPISSLVINLKLLQKELGKNSKLDRMQQSIDTILMLQNNLKYFLVNSSLQKEPIKLDKLILERVNFFKVECPNIKFNLDLKDIKIQANKDAFIRVIDNLISNGCKHNINNGYLSIYLKDNRLFIENSSNRIKNPNKLFNRYYKESKRGLGIGLDIVKKLTKQMDIDISFKSYENRAIFILDLSKIILK